LSVAAASVDRYAWVVLTSVNAVDHFMGALRDARALAAVLVAAVGPATADALRAAGVEPDLVPAEHSARGLIEVFPEPGSIGAHAVATAHVLFPCADLAPDTIVEGLAQKGWQVDRVEAYRTVLAAPPAPQTLARVARADALTLAATSSVQAFLALRIDDVHLVPVPPHVVCIGSTTAAAARQAGMDGVHEAWGASAQGIVDELVHHFGVDSEEDAGGESHAEPS
jgi:uroporphyrinogen III methyltransferase/synthase